jgi:hypothetical protein
MTRRADENPMIHMVEEMVEAVAASQTVGLRILQAEMEALTHVMPGVGHPVTDAERAAADQKIEADFDNMPV